LSGPLLRGTNIHFFLARVQQGRVEGDAATLQHVRERFRRSEAAWSALADKAQHSERLRLEDVERRREAGMRRGYDEDLPEACPRP
jgi:hypothetical protein